MRVACAALLSMSAILYADSLYLTNGAVIEGKIIAEREREVLLRLDSGGVVAVRKAAILRIRRPGLAAVEAPRSQAGPGPTVASPPPPHASSVQEGPGWRIEIPSSFSPWQEASGRPGVRRYRDATTGAAICVVGPHAPLLEGGRPRPVWAPATAVQRALGMFVAKKSLVLGKDPAELVEIEVDLGGARFRELWASIDGGSARVVCACPAEKIELYRPLFERSIRSFRTDPLPPGAASARAK